jgi:hypothetical protein
MRANNETFFAAATVLSSLVPAGELRGLGCPTYGWQDYSRWGVEMDCVWFQSLTVTEQSEVTTRGYRRFRCRDYGRPFNERSGGVLNLIHATLSEHRDMKAAKAFSRSTIATMGFCPTG